MTALNGRLKSCRAVVTFGVALVLLAITAHERLTVAGVPGAKNCVSSNLTCTNCGSYSYYCSPGVPAGVTPGVCYWGGGACGGAAAYPCGEAYDCDSDDDTGVACGSLNCCSNSPI